MISGMRTCASDPCVSIFPCSIKDLPRRFMAFYARRSTQDIYVGVLMIIPLACS